MEIEQKEVEFDRLLEEDDIYGVSWGKLKEELSFLEDINDNPNRLICYHIDHGPNHWKYVRSKARTLWCVACLKQTNWWSAESSFILSSAAYLHDVSMFHGANYVDLTDEDLFTTQVMLFFPPNLRTVRKLTDVANTAAGRLIRRKYQGYIAARVTQAFAETSKPFEDIDQHIVNAIAFIVRYYTVIGRTEEEIKQEVNQVLAEYEEEDRGRFFAMASILQFSDWAHLDSRVDRRYLLKEQEQLDNLIEKLFSSECEEDGEYLCALPTFYRSHYVEPGQLDPITTNIENKSAKKADNTGNINQKPVSPPSVMLQVRFQFKVGLPPDLPLNGIAFQQLVREWRGHFLPSRMKKRLAADLLAEHAYIELLYSEPAPLRDATRFLSPPAFVHDWWVASNWFNLKESTQFFCLRGKCSPIMDFKHSFNSKYLYCERDPKKGIKPTQLPFLSRRSFMCLQVYVTRGHSCWAPIFYKHLHHCLSCIHRQYDDENPFGPSISLRNETEDLLNRLRLMLVAQWCANFNIVVSDEEKTVMTLLGQCAYPTPIEFDRFMDEIGKKAPPDVGKDVALLLIDKALKAKALKVSKPGGAISVSETDEGAVLMACAAYVPLSEMELKNVSIPVKRN